MAAWMDPIADAEGLVLEYLANPQPDVKDLVIVQYSALVERIARRFAGVELVEDLTQVGYIGLLNALSRFDPNAGVRFSTYATHLVAGEIKHYLRDRALTIRQPAWVQEFRQRLTKASSQLQARLGRTPTDEELSLYLGATVTLIQEMRATEETVRVASLDVTMGEEDAESDIDKIDEGVTRDRLTVEDKVVLQTAIQQLRDLEQQVLVLFHFESLNQTEIAARLGISCNYVSHILRQSLTKLRRILVSEETQDRLLRRELQLTDEAVFDNETNTYNEAYFWTRLREEMHRAGAASRACGVVRVEFAGLDSLAAFFGREGVREFVADAAELLREAVRRLDIVCRYGTHGFIVILPATGVSTLVVRRRIEAAGVKWFGERQAPCGSIRMLVGHASFPDDSATAEELVEAAFPLDGDEALLVAA